jgi:hypothetical protein
MGLNGKGMPLILWDGRARSEMDHDPPPARPASTPAIPPN